MTRPLLVGESNPYGADPSYALYPYPERSAGGRLCRLVMRLEPRQYLRAYERVNLCAGRWSLRAARLAGGALVSPDPPPSVIVLLGARVCAAFAAPFEPFTRYSTARLPCVLILPHPSGLSRSWNDPGTYRRAREALRAAGCAVGEEP
jgi:hypothetical protein